MLCDKNETTIFIANQFNKQPAFALVHWQQDLFEIFIGAVVIELEVFLYYYPFDVMCLLSLVGVYLLVSVYETTKRNLILSGFLK